MLAIILSALTALLSLLETNTIQANYTLRVQEQQSAPLIYPGQVTMQGERFLLSMSDTQAAFDGKTLYIYDPDNDELTLSTPTQQQMADVNPLVAARLLAKTCQATERDSKDGKSVIITLTPRDKKQTDLQRCVIRVRKSDSMPLSVEMQQTRQTATLTLQNAHTVAKAPAFTLSIPGAYINDMR